MTLLNQDVPAVTIDHDAAATEPVQLLVVQLVEEAVLALLEILELFDLLEGVPKFDRLAPGFACNRCDFGYQVAQGCELVVAKGGRLLRQGGGQG